jgi:uncharacterized membrane protein
MAANQRTPRFIWTGVIFLALIGVAAATLRTLVLIWPAQFSRGASPAAALDAGFARHVALTLVHILPGALFLVLAPLQFVSRIRERHLQLHRWMGRILVVDGLIIGATALVMSYKMNIGGTNETAATTLFAIVFLICLTKAYWHIRHKEVVRHREWMLRAYAVGMGVATTRPIVGMFFAFRRLSPHEFFGIGFWLGFTITLLVAEGWIDYTRYHAVERADSLGSTRKTSLVA